MCICTVSKDMHVRGTHKREDHRHTNLLMTGHDAAAGTVGTAPVARSTCMHDAASTAYHCSVIMQAPGKNIPTPSLVDEFV